MPNDDDPQPFWDKHGGYPPCDHLDLADWAWQFHKRHSDGAMLEVSPGKRDILRAQPLIQHIHLPLDLMVPAGRRVGRFHGESCPLGGYGDRVLASSA